jgi:hypothetical protein
MHVDNSETSYSFKMSREVNPNMLERMARLAIGERRVVQVSAALNWMRDEAEELMEVIMTRD